MPIQSSACKQESLPTVSLYSLPTESLYSLPTVSLYSLPTVSLYSLPTVSLYSLPTVSLYSLPTVSLYSLPTVSSLYSLPTVSLYSLPMVSLYSLPTVSLYSLPTVSLYSLPAVSHRYSFFLVQQFHKSSPDCIMHNEACDVIPVQNGPDSLTTLLAAIIYVRFHMSVRLILYVQSVRQHMWSTSLPLSVSIRTVYLNTLAREQDLHINDRMHVRFL